MHIYKIKDGTYTAEYNGTYVTGSTHTEALVNMLTVIGYQQ